MGRTEMNDVLVIAYTNVPLLGVLLSGQVEVVMAPPGLPPPESYRLQFFCRMGNVVGDTHCIR